MIDMRDEESDDKVNEVASLLNPAKCICSFAQTEKKERKKEEQNDNRSETRNEKIRMRAE